MRKLKRTGIVIVALTGLIAMSGLAFADEHTEPVVEEPEDTVFNFGYDPVNHILVWNTSNLDGLYDCTLENGDLTAIYGGDVDGVIPVVGLLTVPGGLVYEFEARTVDEISDEFAGPAEGPVQYTDAEGECGLSGAVVAGPNGQINHGQFMKLFNSLYEGKGRGCLNRHLAKSTLGKDDQQVKVSDVEDIVMTDTGVISFERALTDCEHGKKDKGESSGTASANKSGRPESPASRDRPPATTSSSYLRFGNGRGVPSPLLPTNTGPARSRG